MANIVVAGKLHPSGEALLERLRGEGHTIAYVPNADDRAYAAHMAGAEALVVRTQPVTAEIIAGAPKLRVVSRHGVGYDAVDVPAQNVRGIALTIVGDVNSVSVAELAMTQLLAGAKQLRAADHAVRAPGAWGWRNAMSSREVSGKILLILGYGRIGRKLAKMAAGFDMDVRAYDPYLPNDAWPDGAARVDDLGAALPQADYISVHIPSTGRAVLGAAEIAAMKPGVILSNTARGGVIDEGALAAALASGQVAAAGLDVFGSEPPAPDHPLLHSDATILSPHMAGISAEAAERMALVSVQNALDYLAGRIDPALIVNKDALNV